MISRNIAWLAVERIFSAVALLLSNIVVIRYLGPMEFGQLAIFQAILGFFLATSEFGVRRVLVTLGVSSRSPIIYAQAVRVKIVVALCMALALLGILFGNGDVEYKWLILVYLFFSPLEVYSYYFEATLKNKKIAILRFFLAIGSALVRIALCFGDANVIWIAMTFLITPVLVACSSYMIAPLSSFAVQQPRATPRRRRIIRSTIARRGFFFWLSLVIVQVLNRLDIIVLGTITGSADVGLYAASQKIIEQIVAFFAIASIVAVPYISCKARNEWSDNLRFLYSLILIIGILISLPLYFLSSWFVTALYGVAYEQSIGVMEILALALPFMILANVSGGYYSVKKLEKLAFFRNMLALIVGLCLQLFLVREYGLIGVAIGVLATQFLLCFVLEFVHPRCRENAVLKFLAVLDLVSADFYRTVFRKIGDDFRRS